jgi:hypothetical protein
VELHNLFTYWVVANKRGFLIILGDELILYEYGFIVKKSGRYRMDRDFKIRPFREILNDITRANT